MNHYDSNYANNLDRDDDDWQERTMTYSGVLEKREYGEAYSILFLSGDDRPLAEILDESIRGKQVTARYWITEKPCTKEEASEDHLNQVIGLAETDFGARYSEITGYLWTDEECKIGGHDLIDELKYEMGKHLILEIEIHADANGGPPAPSD